MIGKPWSSLGVCDEALNAFARAFGCERHQLADPSCMNCHANGIKGFVAWQTTPHPVPGQTVLPLKPLPDADDAESWAKLAKELEGRAEATAKAIKALAEAQKVTPELMNQIVYALDTQRNVESYLLDRVATSPVPGQTREVTEPSEPLCPRCGHRADAHCYAPAILDGRGARCTEGSTSFRPSPKDCHCPLGEVQVLRALLASRSLASTPPEKKP